MQRRPDSKAKAQRKHAKRRASERYNLSINRHDQHEMVRMIQVGPGPNVRFVEKQSLRVSLWEIFFKDQWCKVVYDCQRKTIVTFLPRPLDIDSMLC